MTEPADRSERFDSRGRSLREHAARGTLINGVFLIGVSSLGLLRGFVLAAFLTREDYGIWGILVISMGTVMGLKQIGIGDKYVQQDEPDQEVAFQKAFTLELVFTGGIGLLIAALLPLIAELYGQPEILLPGYVLLALLPALILQAPLWVYYRRMQFLRQRLLQAIEPVVSLVVGIALAAAGAGYWALIIGVVVGSWATALVAVAASPFKLRLRWERGTLRRYASFSWPLLVATGGGIVIAQGSILAAEDALGLAAAGVVTLAAVITQFADRVDSVVTGTLYPAICAVRDRTELLYESFVKSNRLALMWAMPFGVGLSLFAADLVHFGIGDEWQAAIVLLQVYGLTAAFGHIGFNWTAYFRALERTRPMAVASVVAAAAFAATALPLIYSHGIPGFAAGVAAMTAAHLLCRLWYLARLFEGFRFVRHAARAIAPTLPAAAAVGLARWVSEGERTLATSLGELGLYLALVVAFTVWVEGRLVREALRYLRARAPAAA